MSEIAIHTKENLLVPKLRFKEFEREWSYYKLGEIGETVSGLTYSPDMIDEDGVLVLRSSNVQNRTIVFDDNVFVSVEKEVFNPVEVDDILICVRNGSKSLIGKNALINKDSAGLAFGAFMAVYRSKDNKFIFHYLDSQSYKKQVHRNLGATINSINGSDLKKFKVPFPPSLPEQQKIAAFLSAVDEKIQQLTKKKELLEQYKKGVMQQLFSGKLRFKDENGKEYPEWEEVKIGNVFKERSERGFENLELLSVSINQGIFPQSNSSKTDNSSSDKSKYKRVLVNDIAYNTMRMWQGASALSNYNGIVSPAYTILAGNKSNCSKFFAYLFKMTFMTHVFQRYSQGLTSDTWNLKYPAISKIKIKRPCFSEQQKIAVCLSSIDIKIEQVTNQINQTQTFKKGLLQQMFV